MEITTNYSIGDIAYFIYNNKVRSSYVQKIKIIVEPMINTNCEPHISVTYNVGNYPEYDEGDLYVSKEELIKSL